jgi:phage I-like protein
MDRLILATCDHALAPNGAAPEWVQLLPEGSFTGRDGRVFEVADPGALVLDFQSRGVDLPIDYEHQNDKPEAKLSGPVPAAGWIKELKIAEGGIWGRVEWTETASELISRKEYRFLSPSLLIHPKTRQVHRLKGAGLVHNPNLFLTALASQEDTMNSIPPAKVSAPSAELSAQLAILLGLPPETSSEDLMKSLAGRMGAQPDPAKFVPIETLQELLAERRDTLQTTSEERVQFKIAEASRKGYLAGGAMREWATELCRSDEAAFDKFLQTTGPLFGHLLRPSHTAQPLPEFLAERRASRGAESELEAAVCSQLGLKPGSLID